MNHLPNVPQSTLLPEDARRVLFAASQMGSPLIPRGDDMRRNIAVESAVYFVRCKYPQLFKPEPQI